jgi:hypothetical protein
VSNLVQTPSEDRRILADWDSCNMWLYLQVLLPLCTVTLAGALCIGVVSFILGHSKPQA